MVRLGPGGVPAAAAPGSPVTVRWADGSTGTYTVASKAVATTAAAAELVRAAPAGRLVVLVAAGGGRWTVLTAD